MKPKRKRLRLAPVVKLHDFHSDLKAAVAHRGHADIVAYAVVTVRADGMTTSAFNQGEAGVSKLFGAVEILRIRMARELIE